MAWPALAGLLKGGAAAGAAGGGGGAAAGGAAKGGGMMSKMGGMMGKGGGGGGGGGGGMMSGLMERANMPKQATMGLATGAFQALQAMKLKKKAESAMPPTVDPRQAAFLSELNQKRKAIDTGADFAAGMSAVDTTQAGTNENIIRAGGGDAGGTMMALLQAQRGASDAKNKVLAEGQGQQQFYTSQFGDLNNKIAARAMQLQMYRSQQARAEWAAKKQAADANIMAGVAGLMEQKQSYGKPVTENQTGSPSMPSMGGAENAFNTGWNPSFKKDTTVEPPNQVKNITMDPKQTAGMPVTSAATKNMVPGATEFLMNLGAKK